MSDSIPALIAIPRPHVPFGPNGIPEATADADYLREAARHIEGGFPVGGSNLTATVLKLPRDAADALELLSASPGDDEREEPDLLKYAVQHDHPEFGRGWFFSPDAIESLIADTRRLSPLTQETLDLLDELNSSGRIAYDDYSRLHDAVSRFSLPEPAEDEYQAVCGSWECRAPECRPKGEFDD